MSGAGDVAKCVVLGAGNADWACASDAIRILVDGPMAMVNVLAAW